MTITFIVPVYKVEAYLRQCVESITCQTYRNFEIILVDDGSPDGSPALCDQLANEDSRIRVIHKKNGGLSDARNAGVKEAVGDYVTFCDSDDFWDNNKCLEKLVSILLGDSDIDVLCYNFKKLYEVKKIIKEEPLYSDKVLTSANHNTCLYELAKQGVFPVSACTKLIRRKFFIDNNLFFIKGLISEDIPWYIDLMSKANRCKYVNIYAYVYRQNVSGSITNSFSEKKFNDRIGIIENEIKKIEHRNLTKDGKKALLFFLAYEYVQFIADLSQFKGEKRKEVYLRLSKCKWLLNYNLNKKVTLPKFACVVLGLENTAKLISIYNKIRR